MSIPVKNVSAAAQSVEGCGILEHGQTGDAADTDHTAALIDAELLIPMTETARTVEKRPAGKPGKD